MGEPEQQQKPPPDRNGDGLPAEGESPAKLIIADSPKRQKTVVKVRNRGLKQIVKNVGGLQSCYYLRQLVISRLQQQQFLNLQDQLWSLQNTAEAMPAAALPWLFSSQIMKAQLAQAIISPVEEIDHALNQNESSLSEGQPLLVIDQVDKTHNQSNRPAIELPPIVQLSEPIAISTSQPELKNEESNKEESGRSLSSEGGGRVDPFSSLKSSFSDRFAPGLQIRLQPQRGWTEPSEAQQQVVSPEIDAYKQTKIENFYDRSQKDASEPVPGLAIRSMAEQQIDQPDLIDLKDANFEGGQAREVRAVKEIVEKDLAVYQNGEIAEDGSDSVGRTVITNTAVCGAAEAVIGVADQSKNYQPVMLDVNREQLLAQSEQDQLDVQSVEFFQQGQERFDKEKSVVPAELSDCKEVKSLQDDSYIIQKYLLDRANAYGEELAPETPTHSGIVQEAFRRALAKWEAQHSSLPVPTKSSDNSVTGLNIARSADQNNNKEASSAKRLQIFPKLQVKFLAKQSNWSIRRH